MEAGSGLVSADDLIADARRLKQQRAELIEEQGNNRELLRLLARTGKLDPKQEAEVNELFKRGDS